MKRDSLPDASDLGWRLGQLLQGIIVGPLLFFAILGLLALSGDVAPFSYQGY
ncbi:hypothetical protein GCM10007036_31270 [Alsobacter metallidurans]|uniref:Uncharacterized protein n=1 Tax=Alsobacter metallidurans TaxID=340221 RepID=A0A917MKM6_9HYPH|nr:hypothetical protein GCM10007036_31270 [Alsobacter metallidurans]